MHILQSGKQTPTEQKQRSYLEKSVEAWFLFLTPNNSVLAHFKEVDERWVGLHQLFRLQRKRDGGKRHSKESPHKYKNDVSHRCLFKAVFYYQSHGII